MNGGQDYISVCLLSCRKITWFYIPNHDIDSIWSPTIYVDQAIKLDQLGSFGDNSNQISRLWFKLTEKRLSYSEIIIATIGCDFDFNPYPFDNHVCKMYFNNWVGGRFRVQLSPPKIYTVESNHFEIEGQNLLLSNQRLQYNCMFQSMPSKTFTDMKGRFSRSIIHIHLTRTKKSRDKIFGSFHLSTGIFAAISTISFIIPTDSVPGRMGLLITLYLILVNTYGSIKAPSKRGFSTIEVWFFGVQAPLIFAIVEYAALLVLKKFFSSKNFKILKSDYSTAEFSNFADIVSLCLSVLFQLLFNVYYWTKI